MIKIQKEQQISLIKESRLRKSMKELNNGPHITNKIRMNEYKMLYLGSKINYASGYESLCGRDLGFF